MLVNINQWPPDRYLLALEKQKPGMGQVVKTFAYIEWSLDCDRLWGLLLISRNSRDLFVA